MASKLWHPNCCRLFCIFGISCEIHIKSWENLFCSDNCIYQYGNQFNWKQWCAYTTFQQIMPRSLKQRDYSIQEVMYHLLSLKSISTSYEAVHVSLCVYHRDNIRGNQQPCTLRSTLDIYAEWKKYLTGSIECKILFIQSRQLNL